MVGQRLKLTFSNLETNTRIGPLLTPVGVPCHRHSPVFMRPALSRSPALAGEGNHMPAFHSCQHLLHNSHAASPVPTQAPQARTARAKISGRPDAFQTRKSHEPQATVSPPVFSGPPRLQTVFVTTPAKAGVSHHARIGLQSRRDGGPGGRLHTKRSIPVWSMVATPGLLDDQITVPLAMDGASRAVTYHR